MAQEVAQAETSERVQWSVLAAKCRWGMVCRLGTVLTWLWGESVSVW